MRNVRARRAALGISARVASERVNLSLSQWQRIEAGKCNVTIATLVKLSNALGMEIADLLRKPKPKPKP